MKIRSGLFALLLVPAVAGAAQPRSVALVIQDNGHAQVTETHDVPPPGADGAVRIGPLPETLLPASVSAAPLERGETLDVVSQRFLYDLRDAAALFGAYRGSAVVGRKGDATWAGRLAAVPDFAQAEPGLLLEAEGQPVRFIPDLFALDAVEFPARADLARHPTLLWQLAADQSPPAAIQLNYAASGLSWSASHEAILADDARAIALATRVHVRNRTQRDFANARVRLALTEKGQYAPLVPAAGDPRTARAPALRYAADGQSWVPERAAASAAVVATYDVPQPLTLAAGADVRAGLYSAPALAAETRHVYDGVRFDRYQRNRRTDGNLGTEYATVVETRLSFANESAAPLPPGEFRLLRGQADQALEWIGTDWLPALKPGAIATLDLGPAAGLSGRRLRTAYADVVPLQSADESFEITLENQTSADQTIVVVEHFYRGEKHEITAASAKHEPGANPHSVQFAIPVKAGTSQAFTYTVRYTW